MSNPYVGEIRLFAGNFAPQGWAFCSGQLLAISQNDVLFQLIGTTYGGDGQQTFALPDLRGRVPVHQGSGFVIGQMAGSETITLTQNQIPGHTHVPRANTAAASVTAPGGAVLAATSVNSYGPGPATVDMAAQAIAPAGGSQPHENMAPTLALSYIISLFGIFPSQN
jgi:microcystin-dependent protein